MSRTEPWAPANLPSTIVPVIATSTWARRPSGSGISVRKRCSSSGRCLTASHTAAASGRSVLIITE
jgi:hypothetical protein